MATTVKTRVQNKRATLTNWKTVWETFKPLDGEIILIEITSASEAIDTPVQGYTEFPVTLTKIGDGTTTLKALDWAKAVPTNTIDHTHDISISAPTDTHSAIGSITTTYSGTGDDGVLTIGTTPSNVTYVKSVSITDNKTGATAPTFNS